VGWGGGVKGLCGVEMCTNPRGRGARVRVEACFNLGDDGAIARDRGEHGVEEPSLSTGSDLLVIQHPCARYPLSQSSFTIHRSTVTKIPPRLFGEP
jgi:hypothetical protein